MTPERHAQDARDADGHGTLVRRVWRDAAHPEGLDNPDRLHVDSTHVRLAQETRHDD